MILSRLSRSTALRAHAFQWPTQVAAIRTITSYDSSPYKIPTSRNIEPVLFCSNKKVSLLPKTYHKIQSRGIVSNTWETIPAQPEVLGAILPFAKLNFVQVLVFPCTYLVMYYMDFLLNYMPWWLTIMATTTTIRLLLYRFTIRQNIIGIKTNNLLPETQKIQIKMNEAFAEGDSNGAALQRQKLKALYEEHGISIQTRLKPLLAQMPFQLATFFLIKKLALEPTTTMATGGALWFNNLTLPDPYYILPVLLSASTFITMNYGLEGTSGPLSKSSPFVQWTMRMVPLGLLVASTFFPSGITLFWTTSNFITLMYAMILKNKSVKRYFNIPKSIDHDLASLPMYNLSFTQQFKQSQSARSSTTTYDIRRLDDVQFRKAGIGPLQKTYKEMPASAVEKDKIK